MALIMLTFTGLTSSAQAPDTSLVSGDSLSYVCVPTGGGNYLLYPSGSQIYLLIGDNLGTTAVDWQGVLDDLDVLPTSGARNTLMAQLDPDQDGTVDPEDVPEYDADEGEGLQLCCKPVAEGECSDCWCWAYKCKSSGNCYPCASGSIPKTSGPYIFW